jgi:hypothetical protein
LSKLILGVSLVRTVLGSVAPTEISHTNPEIRTVGIKTAAGRVKRLKEASSPAAAILSH